ncbi:MAG: CRISPR-associated helicase Cas3' [Alicyclobacillus herbarius]|uniref:CRISPR-associated helicase Cas3' n=1 Tax=Alicyclobacillus herbarius TaxID=122960 RepID=UPI002353D2D4|nr:CRISPR-associated helicase Cas3' [Alicyclobacillus herbarius]MCL6633562.1 CRISPR-associated helicase Cas3' [Alicyclobacillus herbarius]
MVIPFDECIARPPMGALTFPLVTHLDHVAEGMGRLDGAPLERLSYLAGWLHDIGKAHAKWQWYIREPGGRKGPPHAVYGAVLFAYVAEHLMKIWQPGSDDEPAWMAHIQWLCRDIMDHHGRLRNLTGDEPPWSGRTLQWRAMDLASVRSRLVGKFPELASLSFSAADLDQWAARCRRIWYRWYDTWAEEYEAQRYSRHPAEWAVDCLRLNTSALIRADRFDAAGLQPRVLTQTEIDAALDHLVAHVEQTIRVRAETNVQRLRAEIAREALRRYQASNDASVYVLKVPTGYGKTLTGLRVALEIARHRRCERIVYVAPYLSLLSQSAQVIAEATGLDVMVHHGLSLADVFSDTETETSPHAAARVPDRNVVNPDTARHRPGAEEDIPSGKFGDEQALLLLESWQAPVVVTTFNQFFRALFPARAQDTLRLPALRKAVVFIDEPQIIDHAVWAPFLALLQAVTKKMGAVCLFSTATLPPLQPDVRPVHLEPPDVNYPQRYRLVYEAQTWSELDVTEVLFSRERNTRSLAVMMNTIGDAIVVLESLQEALAGFPNKPRLFVLHGLMTPLHKRVRIAQIRDALDHGERVWIVTTQALEAGVDLSFDVVYRALPIFPSVVQAAGRVNRHGESRDPGRIHVFRFVRGGKQDTRPYVYRDAIVREETDASVALVADGTESDLYREIDDFFARILRRRDGQAALELLRRAAQGEWNQVAGWAPFTDDGWRIPVFVPWGDDVWMSGFDGRVQRLMERFSFGSAAEIYERYKDFVWMRGLTMVERKRFLGLLQQFIVDVPPRLAHAITANFVDEIAIKRVADIEAYDEQTGFGRAAIHGATDLFFA